MRDLTGYAGKPPALQWPNGARVAVSVVVNFEEGAEAQVGDGDERNERIGEVLSVVPDNTRDQGQEQIFAYGMRVGLWRMLDALAATDTPATFLFCGRAVERSPDNARAVVLRGHEAACHGWRWQPHANYSSEQAERQDLVRCIETIRAATGQTVQGFFCRGSESQHTRKLLSALGFVYTSNAFDDDLPYWDSTIGDGLLVVPYSLDTNDMKFFHPNGFVCAQDMVDYVLDALDTLLDEAERGKSSVLNIGLHLRICGRPARFVAVKKILEHCHRLGDRIWRARRIDIAHHFASAYPSPTTNKLSLIKRGN